MWKNIGRVHTEYGKYGNFRTMEDDRRCCSLKLVLVSSPSGLSLLSKFSNTQIEKGSIIIDLSVCSLSV